VLVRISGRRPWVSVMGQLKQSFGGFSGNGGVVARNAISIVLATPLVAIVVRHLYDQYGTMNPTNAVVIFGIAAGATQFAMQGVGSNQFGKLDRDIHVAEIAPALAAAVPAVLVISWALLPPNPNPVTTALEASGSLPS